MHILLVCCRIFVETCTVIVTAGCAVPYRTIPYTLLYSTLKISLITVCTVVGGNVSLVTLVRTKVHRYGNASVPVLREVK